MARIASQAKMGYYPTPPVVVEHVKSALSLSSPGPYRFLDTCCGEGEALNLLAAGLGPEVETYGVELDESRLKKSALKLNHVVWGDALTELRVSAKAFSLLWLNPPYDWDSEAGGRLEARFLEAHLRYLMPKGWLVFIIPLQALKGAREALARLRNLQVYAFPKPEYDVFKQLVVIGQANPTLQRSQQMTGLTEFAWLSAADVWERLPKTSEMPAGSMLVPPAPEGRVRFSTERADMEKEAELVTRSPLWKDLEVMTAAKALHNVRPLAQLRQGHLAMLLAGGLMNGKVEGNGKRLVIKGSVQKKVDKETETTDTHYIERATVSHQIIIRAIDLDKREILTIS
jgi:SAM-dependent methyltransferase